MSTTISTGPGDPIAGERLLTSELNSAIFDLAVLAPSAISPDPANKIAITPPLTTNVVPVSDTSSLGFDPGDMLTAGVNSLAPVVIETPLKAFSFSGGPLPEASSEKNDVALTQALTALATLEQTGRSSLIPQKVRPDLLPSILKARLGFETPSIDNTAIPAEQVDLLAPILTFPSSPEGEVGDQKPLNFERGASVANLETVEMRDLMSDMLIVSPQANAHESVSTQAANKLSLSRPELFSVSGTVQSVTPTIDGETDFAPDSIIPTASTDRISAIPASPSESRSPSIEFRTISSVHANEETIPAARALVDGVVRPEAITALSVATPVGLDSTEQARPIEKAQRDDRPSFIGELIETPKPIILPNQPMPVAPPAPLSDPAPASQHTALVFKNELRTDASEMQSRNTEVQEQSLQRVIIHDHNDVAVSVNIENSIPLIPVEEFNVKSNSARSHRDVFLPVLPKGIPAEEFVNPEAPRTPELKSPSNVEADLAVNIDSSIDKPVTHEAAKAPRLEKNSINNGEIEEVKTRIASEKQIPREVKREDVTSESTSPAIVNDQSLATNTSFLNVIVPPLVVSAHPQDIRESTDQENVGTGSSTKKSISPAPSNLPVVGQITQQSSQKVNDDVTGETEQFSAQPILDLEIDNEAAAAPMSTLAELLTKEFDPSEFYNISMPSPKEILGLIDQQISSGQATPFTSEKMISDKKNSEYHRSREDAFITQMPSDDENLFKTASKEDFEATKLAAADTSIIDETVKAKLPTGTSVSISPTQSEPVDILPLTTGDQGKKAIEAVELSKSVIDSIRDVTVMTRHNANIDHNSPNGEGYVPSSTSFDYRSGYAVPLGAATQENTAAPAYASNDNPLFQFQRDRAVEAQVIAALKAGRNEVRLSLYPPQLGQVTINLALDGQKVKVALKTSSREATDLLTSEQPSLAHALQREGFSLEGFDVTEDGPHDNRKDDSDQTIISPVPASSGSSEFSIDITI